MSLQHGTFLQMAMHWTALELSIPMWLNALHRIIGVITLTLPEQTVEADNLATVPA